MNRYEGKTLEEALLAAAASKKSIVEDVTYYVIEEKTGGFLGLGAKVVIEAFIPEDIRDFIEDYLNKYFKGIELPCEVIVNMSEDKHYFKIILNAENNSILIGKNGQTLQSITNVLKNAANAQFKRRVNLSVDVNGYKEERYEKLKEMVDRLAKTVIKTHVSVKIDHVSADERKVIHQHLSDVAHIRTESEGEGQRRCLKIIYDHNKN